MVDSFCDDLSCAVAGKSFKTRASDEGDREFLKRLYSDVRKAEVGSWGWDSEAVRQFMELQFRAQSTAYMARFPDADDVLLLDGEAPFGRVLIQGQERELRLVDLALLEDYRGKGLGRLILECLKARASKMGKAVTLSVHRVNGAVGLYIRCGFEVTGGDDVYLQMRWSADGL